MSLKTKDRLKKLRQGLGEKEIDGILISQPENRHYLSGFNGSAGLLVITPQDAVIATDFRYLAQAKSQAPDYRLLPITGDLGDWLPRLLAELGIKRLGFEAAHLTFARHRQLADIMKKDRAQTRLIPVEGMVESLRAIKEAEEITLITKAAEISDAAMEYIREKICPGMTERQAAWEIERFMREKGSQPLPFDVIVASGPNAAFPHAQPSGRALGEAEPIIIDIGARVGGYGSDLSRAICLGTPDDNFKKIYDTVIGAQATVMAIIKEGMSGGEADQLAREVIEAAGYGAAFGHGLGHGVGLATHELPRLGTGSAEKLASGMVFTIEPGIYEEGWGGVRIEDLVVMEKGKVRQISKSQK